jgi:hypothetical protein
MMMESKETPRLIMAEASLNRAKRTSALTLPALDVTRAGLIIAAVFFFVAALVGTTDPDYFWHLRTGQIIVDDLAVPTSDPFSFTLEGEHWVAHEWLGEVVIYGLQSLGGYGLALLVFASLALGTLLLTYRTSLRLGVSRGAALLFFVWAGVMTVPYWTVRPQVFTWFLLTVFIAVCLEHKAGRRNLLWLLPLLTVVWANLHLGVMFGLAVVGVYAFSQAFERAVWKQPVSLKPIVVTLGACVLATLVNPNPIELLLYPLQYIEPGNTNVEFIKEWQSPNFHNLAFAPLALAFAALLAMGVFGRRRDVFLPLLVLLFGLLTLQSVRNQPLFAIVFMLLASQRASELWGWASATLPPAPPKPHTALNLVLVGVFTGLAVMVVATSPTLQLRSEPLLDHGIQYPAAGAHFLRDNYPEARMFNHYDWGGYLINELYPRKVFIDGRSDFYGDELMYDFRTVNTVQPGWQDVLAKYDVEVMLIKDASPLSDRLDAAPETWVRVFTGDSETVFARADIAR